MSNLPYDVEIEYLESTGTQWIDSGVQSQNNLVYDFKLYETNDNNQRRFFGFKESSDWLSNGMNDANWGSSFFYVDFANTETNITALNSKGRRNNNGIYHFDFTDGNAKLIHNNTQVWTSNKTGTYDGSQTVYVFSLNYNGSSSAPGIGRIYYFQIRKNGVLLRDYIPVRVGNVGYLYDKVSGELFGNAGTGDFILGEDKALPNPFGFRRRLMIAQSGEETIGGNLFDFIQTPIDYKPNAISYTISGESITFTMSNAPAWECVAYKYRTSYLQSILTIGKRYRWHVKAEKLSGTNMNLLLSLRKANETTTSLNSNQLTDSGEAILDWEQNSDVGFPEIFFTGNSRGTYSVLLSEMWIKELK